MERSSGASAVITSLSIWTCPESGVTRPAARWRRVLFPEPLGPMIAHIWPPGISSVTSRRASTRVSPSPKCLLMFENRINDESGLANQPAFDAFEPRKVGTDPHFGPVENHLRGAHVDAGLFEAAASARHS